MGSNAARVNAYNAATAPSAVMGHVTDAEALDQLIAGAAQSDFTHQQHAPRGPAMAHSLLIQTLWNWNANGCKALVTQRESLLRTDVFPPNTWPVFEGKAGTYFEAQTIIGMLHLAKVRKEPGSIITNFSLLPWTKNDDLKYVYVCGGVHCIYTYNNKYTHENSWGAFAPGNPDGCAYLRQIRRHDARSPTQQSVSTFGWTVAAIQHNGFFFENPDPKTDNERLHANQVEHGMVFTPNGGHTFMTSVWFKSPYHSTFKDVNDLG